MTEEQIMDSMDSGGLLAIKMLRKEGLMAHHIRVVARPYVTKDGKVSPKKRRWEVVMTGRGTRQVIPADNKAHAQGIKDGLHGAWLDKHRKDHPNDKAFAGKHRLS